MNFEWDPKKNESNQAKHGFMFESATRVFDQEDTVTTESPRNGQMRYKTIGKIFTVIVVVVWRWAGNNIIRIISARTASKKERSFYKEQNNK